MALINRVVRCCITKDAVDSFKHRFENEYGKIITDNQALWFLGFNTKGEVNLTHHLVRCSHKKHLVYKTDVYKGFVRKKVKGGTELHELADLYEQEEVLVGDFIPQEVMDILTIGDIKCYNKVTEKEW